MEIRLCKKLSFLFLLELKLYLVARTFYCMDPLKEDWREGIALGGLGGWRELGGLGGWRELGGLGEWRGLGT